MASNGNVPFETLHFMGRMNVHLTHELQNVMATISETYGLLEDLADYAAAGGQVEESRLQKLRGRIGEELERGHKLVTHINTLAHSVDEPRILMDVARVVRFMAEASPCMPFSRPIDLTVEPGCQAEAEMAPYDLEQLLYGCFKRAFAGLPQESRLALALASREGTCRLTFSGLAKADPEAEPFPDTATAKAAEALKADITLDQDQGVLAVSLKLAP